MTISVSNEVEDEQAPAASPLRLQLVPHRHTKARVTRPRLSRLQIVHLIRHGQASMTLCWVMQAWALNWHIKQLGSRFRVDAVVVSPLTRTLETAAGVFGSGPWREGSSSQPPLMLEQTVVPGKRAAHHAIAAEGCPPFIAWEGCREQLGKHPCDKRRPMREISPSFPAVDFSLLESDEDNLWLSADWRESHDEIRKRGVEFVRWLQQRPEQHIAVVSHSAFLFFMMSNFGRGAATSVQSELHKWYDNCEMRTVVLCDEDGAHNHADPLWFQGGQHSVK
ncbi:Phosphoglycerate mutase-like protein [Chlorella vulgaris]